MSTFHFLQKFIIKIIIYAILFTYNLRITVVLKFFILINILFIIFTLLRFINTIHKFF